MKQKEIENVILLGPLERYKYFIKKVADWEIFFTMIDEKGNYVISELDNQKLFPVWSAMEFAELCKTDGWEEFTIKQLDLDNLEDEIIDFIADSDSLINVFPVNDRTGFVVSLQEFTRDLSEELKKYG